MSGFVNDSLSNLVATLNNTILARRLDGSAVYSKFNLKVLLFLASRGFLSDVRISLKGSGGFIYFKFKTSDSGTPVISRIFRSSVKGSKLYRSQYSSVKSLRSVYSSEFVVVSTSKGLMTAVEAMSLGVGGFVVLVIL